MTRSDFFKKFPLALGGAILRLRASDERIEIDGKNVTIQNTHVSAGIDLTNCPQVSMISNYFDLKDAPSRTIVIRQKLSDEWDVIRDGRTSKDFSSRG